MIFMKESMKTGGLDYILGVLIIVLKIERLKNVILL